MGCLPCQVQEVFNLNSRVAMGCFQCLASYYSIYMYKVVINLTNRGAMICLHAGLEQCITFHLHLPIVTISFMVIVLIVMSCPISLEQCHPHHLL